VDPPQDERLDALERQLDGLPFRVAARLAARWHTRKRASDWQPPRAVDDDASAEAALRAALTAGALETARQLTERSLSSGGRTAGPAVIESLIMLGRREEAAELAGEQAASLRGHARGAALLELVDHPWSPDVLPNGRPHLLRLSRKLQRGQLDAAALVRLLPHPGRALLASPDLFLLFCSAMVRTEPPRGVRFLNRLLAAHGAPALRWREPGSGEGVHLLQQLETAPLARASDRSVPLVTVLLPAFNCAASVGYAVDSLCAQSHNALEILVGDDASDDGTLAVLEQRAKVDPRVRVFRSRRNQGPYNLKNALARQARGQFLTFHDADDLALPDRIERQLAPLLRSPSKIASVASFARVRPDGSFVFFKDQRAVRLAPVTTMLTRSAFAAVGGLRSARVGADNELLAALRARFGPAAIARIRAPVMLGAWSATSTTRLAGTESLEDGYRAPARRAYSQLIYEHYVAGRMTRDQLDAATTASLNYVEPADLVELPTHR
jgi:hypothetical protein